VPWSRQFSEDQEILQEGLATIHCYMLYTAYLDVRRRWLCCFCNEIVDAFRGVLLYYILSHLIHMSIWCSVFWKNSEGHDSMLVYYMGVFFLMFAIDIRRQTSATWPVPLDHSSSFWSPGYDPKKKTENLSAGFSELKNNHGVWLRSFLDIRVEAIPIPLNIPNLVMTHSSPWYRWPIEIDGLPGFTY